MNVADLFQAWFLAFLAGAGLAAVAAIVFFTISPLLGLAILGLSVLHFAWTGVKAIIGS